MLDSSFCVDALEEALSKGRPEIFNTDQGSQFTGDDFLDVLRDHGVAISMDGRGRFSDNIFVERLWRSLKFEEVYLKAYQTVADARCNIAAYFEFYNHERLHQGLGYRVPRQVFEEALPVAKPGRGRKTEPRDRGTMRRRALSATVRFTSTSLNKISHLQKNKQSPSREGKA
jgi:putative transposase